MFKRILGNDTQDSGECLKRFQGMFEEIPGNVQEDFGECWIRFQGMLAKIFENTQKGWTLYNAIKRK